MQNLRNGYAEDEKQATNAQRSDNTNVETPRSKQGDEFASNNIISVDTSKAKNSHQIVRKCIRELGWKEITTERKYKSCDIYWQGFFEDNTSITSGAINKFPAMSTMMHKIFLFKALDFMKSLWPEEYNFYPKTWSLPHEYPVFCQSFRESLEANPKQRPTYIVKPDVGSQGRGIYLLRDPQNYDANSKENHIAQEYLKDVYTIDSFKFDLRVYCVLRSLHPLKIYICKEGLGRFSTLPYTKPTKENINERFMHLTNYSLNKKSETFITTDKAGEGSKRHMTSVFKTMSEAGCDVDTIWNNIEKLICKTIIAVLPHLHVSCFSAFPVGKRPACSQILGFDILIMKNLKPMLLEVNSGPSLSICHEVEITPGVFKNITSRKDEEIKFRLVRDALLLMAPKSKLRINPVLRRPPPRKEKHNHPTPRNKSDNLRTSGTVVPDINNDPVLEKPDNNELVFTSSDNCFDNTFHDDGEATLNLGNHDSAKIDTESQMGTNAHGEGEIVVSNCVVINREDEILNDDNLTRNPLSKTRPDSSRLCEKCSAIIHAHTIHDEIMLEHITVETQTDSHTMPQKCFVDVACQSDFSYTATPRVNEDCDAQTVPRPYFHQLKDHVQFRNSQDVDIVDETGAYGGQKNTEIVTAVDNVPIKETQKSDNKDSNRKIDKTPRISRIPVPVTEKKINVQLPGTAVFNKNDPPTYIMPKTRDKTNKTKKSSHGDVDETVQHCPTPVSRQNSDLDVRFYIPRSGRLKSSNNCRSTSNDRELKPSPSDGTPSSGGCLQLADSELVLKMKSRENSFLTKCIKADNLFVIAEQAGQREQPTTTECSTHKHIQSPNEYDSKIQHDHSGSENDDSDDYFSDGDTSSCTESNDSGQYSSESMSPRASPDFVDEKRSEHNVRCSPLSTHIILSNSPHPLQSPPMDGRESSRSSIATRLSPIEESHQMSRKNNPHVIRESPNHIETSNSPTQTSDHANDIGNRDPSNKISARKTAPNSKRVTSLKSTPYTLKPRTGKRSFKVKTQTQSEKELKKTKPVKRFGQRHVYVDIQRPVIEDPEVRPNSTTFANETEQISKKESFANNELKSVPCSSNDGNIECSAHEVQLNNECLTQRECEDISTFPGAGCSNEQLKNEPNGARDKTNKQLSNPTVNGNLLDKLCVDQKYSPTLQEISMNVSPNKYPISDSCETENDCRNRDNANVNGTTGVSLDMKDDNRFNTNVQTVGIHDAGDVEDEDCLEEIYQTKYSAFYEQLRITEKFSQMFIQFLGIVGSQNMGPSGFRIFSRKCKFSRMGMSSATLDIMYNEHKGKYTKQKDTTGICYRSFVDICLEIARRRFWSQSKLEMTRAFLSYCEHTLNPIQKLSSQSTQMNPQTSSSLATGISGASSFPDFKHFSNKRRVNKVSVAKHSGKTPSLPVICESARAPARAKREQSDLEIFLNNRSNELYRANTLPDIKLT